MLWKKLSLKLEELLGTREGRNQRRPPNLEVGDIKGLLSVLAWRQEYLYFQFILFSNRLEDFITKQDFMCSSIEETRLIYNLKEKWYSKGKYGVTSVQNSR